MSLALRIEPLPVGSETGKFDKVVKQYKGLLNIQRQWEVYGMAQQSAEQLIVEAKSLFDAYSTLDGATTNTTSLATTPGSKYVFPNTYLEEQGIVSEGPKKSSAILSKTYQEAYTTFREIAKPIESTDDRGRKATQRTMVILNGSAPLDDALGTPDAEFVNQVYTKQVAEIGNAVTIVKRDFIEATETLEEIGEKVMTISANNTHGTIRTYIILNSAGQAAIDGVQGTPDVDSSDQIYVSQVAEQNGVTTTVRRTFLEPNIMSVTQQLTGGIATVQVQAFGMTESQVNTALSEVTSSHKLVSEHDSDFEGIKTSTFTYEVDDFEVLGQTEVGFNTLTRRQLSASPFTSGTIGTDTYSSLYLSSETIDNDGSIKVRNSKWSERGVITIRPIQGEEFSLAPSYTYVTLGLPASSIAGLTKPDGSALGSAVTWFEPSVQNVEGFPTYSQDVLTATISGDEVLVDTHDKFFTITDPGVMSVGWTFNYADKSGAAVRFPQATSQPKTYRKKATVDIYLTTSNLISEEEVAYTEKNTDWCSIAFDNIYTSEKSSSASADGRFKSFPQYLNSADTSGITNAFSDNYYTQAQSYGAGDTSYATEGIYRVELDKYQRKLDATQVYIKTVITFA